MKNTSLIVILTTLLFNITGCSTDNNPVDNTENNSDYFIKMFSGIKRLGFVNISNNNSIYIRENNQTSKIEFIRIDNSGNLKIVDVTSVFSNYGLSENHILFDFDNHVSLVFLERLNSSQNNINLVSLDYDGNLINKQILESNTNNYALKNFGNSFITYGETRPPQEHNLYYNLYNKGGNLINSNTIDLSSEHQIIDNVAYENNIIYLIGKSNFIQGQGYTNQFCRGFDNNNVLLNANSWDFIQNSNNELKILYNKIHRTYQSGFGTNIEIYDLNGNLINSTFLQQALNYTYNSNEQFTYISYNNSSEKNLDFKVLNNLLDSEIYSKNFGADNSTGSTGTVWIFEINETEISYTIFGQTTAPKNGDFNQPSNSDSFDDFFVRLNKN
jgi:hypothetical protein